MTRDDEDFGVRLGRPGDRGTRPRTFVAQVLRAARAGRPPKGAVARSRFGRGREAALAAGLRSPSRRVVVQVRVVRHRGRRFRAAPLAAHLSYLKRDGVTRAGAAGVAFGAEGPADERGFLSRCAGDRHHFRIMVSPEDAGQLEDLRATTRSLMRRMEADLGTRLDWLAVDHWNTGHGHVHILVRGVADGGQDLVIAREYIARGMRARAEQLVSLELGPRTAREIAAALERETGAERWTSLDRALARLSRDGVADLRPGAGAPDLELRATLARRAGVLERLGLAARLGPGVWRLSPDAEPVLREMQLRADVVRSLHRAFAGRGAGEFALDRAEADGPLVGRLVERGLWDEQSGAAYAIVDGIDGRAHHLRFPDLEAAGDTPSGGLVELGWRDGRPRLLHRSDLDLEGQARAQGATWLDRRLVARDPLPLADHGFGAEVKAALRAREAALERMGLARRKGGLVRLAPGLLEGLRDRELAEAAARVTRETGLAAAPLGEGPISGRYLRRLDLASGRFAVIADGDRFRLAPWSRGLEGRRGREVAGVAGPDGVRWDLGRGRGL